MFSRSLVETKRLGRSLSAVINGLSASDATSKGLIEESDVDYASDTNDESLFLPESSEEEQSRSSSRSDSPLKGEHKSNGLLSTSNQDAPRSTAVFGQPSSSLKPRPQGPESFAPSSENSQTSNVTASTSKINPFAMHKDLQIEPVPDRPAMSTGSSNPSSTVFKEGPASFNPFRKPAGQPDRSSTDATSIFTSKPPTFKPTQLSGGVPAAAQAATSSGPSASPIFGRPSSSLPVQAPLNGKSFPLSNQHSDVPFGVPQSLKSTPFGQLSDLKDKGDTASIQPGNQSEARSLFSGLANVTSTTKSTEAALAMPPQTRAQPVSNSAAKDSKPLFTFSSPQTQPQTNLGQRDPETQSQQPGSAAPGNGHPIPTAFGPKYVSDKSVVFSKPSNHLTTRQDPKPALFPETTKPGQSQHASIEPSASIAAPAFKQTLFGGNISSEKFGQNLKPPSSTPSEPTNSLVNNKPHQITSTPTSTAALQKSDNRSMILDHLAESLMIEEGGLLEHYVEFMVRPLMRTCALKFKDEQSWAVASRFPLQLRIVGLDEC